MQVTVVIPTYNEAEHIVRLIQWLEETGDSRQLEIIVVDGGSSDQTVALVKETAANVVLSPQKGRAAQMNYGAAIAKGECLYFVHADVLPPKEWRSDILSCLSSEKVAGCFSYQFDADDWYLKIVEWSVRQNWFAVGGGDQTMFVRKNVFEEMGGFRTELAIMEDFEFVKRLRRKYAFEIICNNALVSARKYETNNFFFVQLINMLTVLLFNLGFPQKQLARVYRRMLSVR